MKREGDRRSVAPRRAPRVHPHPVEAVAVAVAEPVDGADAREAIKPGNLPSTIPKPCVANVEAPNANAPRPVVGAR